MSKNEYMEEMERRNDEETALEIFTTSTLASLAIAKELQTITNILKVIAEALILPETDEKCP